MDSRIIAQEYQELNGSTIDVFHRPPTPLEFSHLVHISRPVRFNKNVVDFSALHLWSNNYLINKLGNSPISVALTPDGNADALARGPDGRTFFVEPCTETMRISELFKRLENHSSNGSDLTEIAYLQSQNGNLFSPQNLELGDSELLPLRDDVPIDIPWATHAIGRLPDAVNIWIGDSRSKTSIHSDPYENIYTVVRGSKHFILFPPTEGYLLQERPYPRATYSRPGPGLPLEVCPLENAEPGFDNVSWASADPTLPIPDTLPLRMTIHAGETMYLPAGWWHYVTQSGDGEDGRGICIAINWWYDMEMRGDKWVWLSALRRASQKAGATPASME